MFAQQLGELRFKAICIVVSLFILPMCVIGTVLLSLLLRKEIAMSPEIFIAGVLLIVLYLFSASFLWLPSLLKRYGRQHSFEMKNLSKFAFFQALCTMLVMPMLLFAFHLIASFNHSGPTLEKNVSYFFYALLLYYSLLLWMTFSVEPLAIIWAQFKRR